MNPNKILGIAPGASAQEVQTAFRKKAFESHPDQNQSPEAIEAFIRIKEARDALMKQALEQPDTTAKDASTARQAAQRAGPIAQQPPPSSRQVAMLAFMTI